MEMFTKGFPRLTSKHLPYNVARCKGVGYEEDGAVDWREGCGHCLRRTSPPNPVADQQQWISPPPIIAFFCEHLIEESDV